MDHALARHRDLLLLQLRQLVREVVEALRPLALEYRPQPFDGVEHGAVGRKEELLEVAVVDVIE